MNRRPLEAGLVAVILRPVPLNDLEKAFLFRCDSFPEARYVEPIPGTPLDVHSADSKFESHVERLEGLLKK
jgi:hypothetical protein